MVPPLVAWSEPLVRPAKPISLALTEQLASAERLRTLFVPSAFRSTGPPPTVVNAGKATEPPARAWTEMLGAELNQGPGPPLRLVRLGKASVLPVPVASSVPLPA